MTQVDETRSDSVELISDYDAICRVIQPFVDFLALCRINGAWKIVNKVFAHTGGQPPA